MQRGVLGCPVCNGEWDVVDGVAHFDARTELSATVPPDATTLAAYLGLTDPQLIVSDGVPAESITTLVREFGAIVVALDSDVSPQSATAIDGAGVVPLADSIANGVVLLRARDGAFVASAVRALATEGRFIATAGIDPPDGIREIARSPDLWVGEREAPVVRVELRRRT